MVIDPLSVAAARARLGGQVRRTPCVHSRTLSALLGCELYLKLENYESAELYFDTVTDKYYNTDFADDAAAMKIRILFRRKQTTKSALTATAIRDFLKKYPSSPYVQEVRGYEQRVATP